MKTIGVKEFKTVLNSGWCKTIKNRLIIPRDRRTVSAVQHNRNSHQHLNSNPHFSTI